MPYITTDQVKKIREEIKRTFPDYKISVTRQHHSSVCVRILAGPTPGKDILERVTEITERDLRIISVDGDYGNIPNYYTDISVGKWDQAYKLTPAVESKFVSNGNTFSVLPESTKELDGLRELKNSMAIAKLIVGMKKTTAKFASKCADTSRYIARGEEMIYDKANKKCYSFYSQVWDRWQKLNKENTDTANMVQAQEEAYFDNFVQQDNFYSNN